MAANAFRTALGRCGYDNATVGYLTQQGFTTTDQFLEFPINEVKPMLKTLAKNLPDGVTLPYQFNLKFLGFRMWLEYRSVRGQDLDAGAYTGDVITKWMRRVTELANATTTDGQDDPVPPKRLTNLADWERHDGMWRTYLGQHRNPTTGVPLTYVLREESDVPDDALTADYDCIDDDLVATTRHEGDQYKADRRRVYELYYPLIYDGPAWTFAKTHAKSKDGREAYLTVKRQATGQAASILRKKQAYAQIANAKFTGRGKYRFHDYIHRHQHAHNTLEELGETVAETKKVTDFMNGITDPTLVQAKTVVNGDQEKLENFEACQQYFLTVHSAAKSETQDDSRKIAAASTTPSKGKGKGRNQKKSKKKKDRVHAGHYDADEWADLTEDECKQVQALRKERKEKRKLGSVTTDDSSNASSKRSKTSHGSTAEDAISVDIDDDAKPEAKTNVSVIMEVDENLLDSSVDNVLSPDKHSKFRASASPAKSSEDDSQPTKSSAGNSFGRFAHKAKAQPNEPGSASVKSVRTRPMGEYETYPPMWQWEEDGRPDMSHMTIPPVPEHGDIFVKLPLPVKGKFAEGPRNVRSLTKHDQSMLKGSFREEIDTIVHNSPVWSWRWSKMSGYEREERQMYHVCRRLAEHTEVFDEALKYTMLANGQLAAAERRRNVCGRYSADLEFDVRDPNVSDKSADKSNSS